MKKIFREWAVLIVFAPVPSVVFTRSICGPMLWSHCKVAGLGDSQTAELEGDEGISGVGHFLPVQLENLISRGIEQIGFIACKLSCQQHIVTQWKNLQTFYSTRNNTFSS